MPLLYSAAIGLYHAGIRCAALWNPKARAWVEGRRGLWQRLEARRSDLRGCLWMHCASVGEFEQGRPVLEAIKAQRPDLPVLLTFFSPSGYEARQNYAGATHVDYLPADTAANATRLVDLIAPRASIFVKYEFWYHHLHALKAKAVPTFLVSAIFRKDQPFFKWYGGAWRAMLACYERIFTQDEASSELLAGIGVKNVTVSGDTRFDRVMEIVKSDAPLSIAHAFKVSRDQRIVIAGSTWSQDEQVLLSAMGRWRDNARWVIVPHELSESHLKESEDRFPGPTVRWSALEYDFATRPLESGRGPFGAATLLVDRMGRLARLYKYGDIAYVGGGFGDGIHSLLEAAAWGKPVIFGPKHAKFAEAKGLIDEGGGFEVRDATGLRTVLEQLLGDPDALATASEAAGKYVRERVGATERLTRILLQVI